MDYGRLGERPRGFQLPFLEIASFILLLGAVVLAMVELVAYSNEKESLPTDLTVAGIAVGGLSETDAQGRWEAIFMQQPVQLFYESSPALLYPEMVNFRVNSDAMLADARAQSSREQDFWAGFWNFLGRRPVAAVSVPLQAELEESDLRAYLLDLAARYDAPPGEAGVDLATLTFQSGRSGRRLDIDAAIPLIRAALLDPDPANRRVTLPTLSADAVGHDMASLHEAILRLAQNMGFSYNGPETLLSVYVMDLQTGEEVKILSDVPHSARSVIKIPIMINVFRKELIVTQEESFFLAESILCSNNSASNYLMQIVGTGDAMQSQMGDGLNQVSCTAQKLGAEYTYINAPLWVADQDYVFSVPVCQSSTPANTSYDTRPDDYAQTTAEDMGRLLVSVYDCAKSGSGLMAIYPDDVTQMECQQMLNLLSGNRIDRLIELGIPPGTPIAHKNGWGIETSADSAIVFSPGGDYVLSVFTWELDPDGNDLPTILSWELIEEISRVTYNYFNYFNPGTPLLQRRTPINPLTAIDCVSYRSPDDVNLNDINANRLDANGNPLPSACYGGTGDCRTFTGWGE